MVPKADMEKAAAAETNPARVRAVIAFAPVAVKKYPIPPENRVKIKLAQSAEPVWSKNNGCGLRSGSLAKFGSVFRD